MSDWDIEFEGTQLKVVDLDVTTGVIHGCRMGGGGYFTKLPISPAEYRAKNPTQAKVVKTASDALTVYCDWGERYPITFRSPAFMAAQIERAQAAGMYEEKQG